MIINYFIVQGAVLTDPSPSQSTDGLNLGKEEVVGELDFPTSMAFLGPNDILVLEKDKGTVRRLVNGMMLEKPVLEVEVNNSGENGLVGIAVGNKANLGGLHRCIFILYRIRRGSK